MKMKCNICGKEDVEYPSDFLFKTKIEISKGVRLYVDQVCAECADDLEAHLSCILGDMETSESKRGK